MNEETVTDALLRQFLLGNVDDEERERVERLFVTDRLDRDRVLAAEQELIDDYLEGSLTSSEKESFILQYGATPSQQWKLGVARSLQELALAQSRATETKTAEISIWDRLRSGIRLKPVFVVPLALASILAIVVVGIWINQRSRQLESRLALRDELSRLNEPASLREDLPALVSLELRPIWVRSVAQEVELVTRADVTVVELRLMWIQQEVYPTYRAEVRRFGEQESVTIGNVLLESEGGRMIRVRLPARLLTKGHYQVELTGISSDGSYGSTAEYNFTVRG